MMTTKCSFIPDFIFQELLEKGDEEQQTLAKGMLAFIKSFSNGLASDFNTDDVQGLFGSKANGERFIHDGESKTVLPGKLVQKEGGAYTKDIATTEAYDGLGWTRKLFKDVFNRNSMDDRGMNLIATVSHGRNYPNAYWNSRQMVFGSGDGRIFNRFTIAIDIASHELTHGVTEKSANLQYVGQSGALNEHFSDVFGSMVKQYSKDQDAKNADWLIGEGLFTSNVNGKSLRDMKNPGSAFDDAKIGRDNQPGHFKDYDPNYSQDSFGVHRWSGIPNRAFANAAINLGGKSWERAGQVWYKALTTKLGKNTQFQEAANMIHTTAIEMFGNKSDVQKAVYDGFDLVGLKPKV